MPRSPAETILATLLAIRMTCVAMLPGALPVPVAVAVTAGLLPHRELRFFAFGNVALGSGQRRPDQPAMHGTFILATIVFAGIGIAVGNGVGRQHCRIGNHGGGYRLGVVRGLLGNRVRLGRGVSRSDGAGTCVFDAVLRQRTRLLATRRRRLPLLVLVLGVTRRTPRLPDVVLDHCDNDVIGDTALARTVVVENVTEPKPALLHEPPPGRSFRLGMKTGGG
jgi:hypothetical protein